MKKILLASIVLLSYEAVIAQTPEDALRYSWLQSSGTARSQALGNANGAIGGEVSTIFSNPANIGFYKTGDFVISGGINLMNNSNTYYGETNKSNASSGFLGTTGFVLGKVNYGNSAVKSSAFGIAVNRTADFNNNIMYKTTQANGGSLVRTSMANMFIEDANKSGLNNLNPYGSGVAYDTYWIDTLSNGSFYSSAKALAEASGLEVKQELITSGGISEIALAGAMNLNEKVYIGGTIGMPILQYRATRKYTEQDPTDNATNQFDVAYFDDDLITRGMGINIKAGVVVKATENFRLGFAAHSPTFYSLTDNYTAAAGTSLENYVTDDGGNAYDASTNELVYDYSLNTPYKLTGSFSYFFGNVNNVASQKGFISGDVEYVNYMASHFRNASDANSDNRAYFRQLNGAIDDAYKGALNARLGAELKFNTFMARLGGAYYGNPYRDVAGETGQVVQASTGVGYRNRGFFIDLGYVHSFGKDVSFPYRLESAAFNPATIKSSNSRILLTLGFKI
ncbi:MAG: OmpP1/FadL family transporter [Niabella sp.]